MDKADHPKKELSEDSTRESLIALSYGVPETEQPAAAPRENTSGETPVCDGEEKYRSELISISYSPATDVKVQPSSPLPVELDG